MDRFEEYLRQAIESSSVVEKQMKGSWAEAEYRAQRLVYEKCLDVYLRFMALEPHERTRTSQESL